VTGRELQPASTGNKFNVILGKYQSSVRHPSVLYGVAGDVPVTGDVTCDGRSDLALYRPRTHVPHVWGSTPVRFGAVGDVPVGMPLHTIERARAVNFADQAAR
jgi:hypothetical protein